MGHLSVVAGCLEHSVDGHSNADGARVKKASLTRALGQEVRYSYVPPEVYRSLGFPGAEDLGNMFQFKRDFEEQFCGARNPAVARALNPALQTFDAWLARNKDLIPLE